MQNRIGAEGAAPAFSDCRDPECDACRATRYYGVSWSADKCINGGRVPVSAPTIEAALREWRPSDNDAAELDSSFDHLRDVRDGDA